ncbi:ParB/RepB/Spo0J family partition protein, partial [Streptomyces sp. NPDC057638]|uniref:ParB/RepB/Spo0J family partition protein n=1 Tax=Streptomyces sp. NPDC057638 TaxID=3346190 RepID=UPI0036C330AD
MTTETSTSAQALAPSSDPTMELVWLNPSEIHAVRNIRAVDLDSDFVASVRERGVLEPVTVMAEDDGTYALVFGFHRRAAAIEAGRALIPAIVRTDISSSAAKIIDQLTENIHRSDMKPSEIAAAYDQLALEGLDVDEIARQVSQDKEKVAATLRLHKMPKTARDAADTGQLDLEEAVQIAEFESEPKVYDRLLGVIRNGGNLPYALMSERRKRKNRAQKAKAKASLVLVGIAVIPQPQWDGIPKGLNSITDAAGTGYTVETHARCAGHAAWVSQEGTVTYVCRDPKYYGHTVTGHYQHLTDEERAQQAREKQEREDRAEALTTAAAVRRDFISTLARSGKTPKGLHKATLAHLFAYGFTRSLGAGGMDEVFALLGATRAKDVPPAEAMRRRIDRTPDHKLPLIHFAQLAVHAEDNMARTASPHRTYGFDEDFAIAWLELLTGYGYTLSEPEETLLAALRETPGDDEEDEYEDEYEEDDSEGEAQPEAAISEGEPEDITTDSEPDGTAARDEGPEAAGETEAAREPGEPGADESVA